MSLSRALDFHFADTERSTLRPLEAAAIAPFFETLGLPAGLNLDEPALRATWLELSRWLHPDYFATAAPEVRELALRRSSLVNNAYKTFREKPRRAEHFMERLGIQFPPEKNAVPPTLLEHLFDIQEAGEELREARLTANGTALAEAEARVAALREEVLAARTALEADFDRALVAYDAAGHPANPATEASLKSLHNIRRMIDQMNYMRTVIRNLK